MGFKNIEKYPDLKIFLLKCLITTHWVCALALVQSAKNVIGDLCGTSNVLQTEQIFEQRASAYALAIFCPLLILLLFKVVLVLILVVPTLLSKKLGPMPLRAALPPRQRNIRKIARELIPNRVTSYALI
jgi:hypothetical protein